MGEDHKQDALTYLFNLSEKQGYVTFDDIINCVDKWNLSISSVDWISSAITARGILVYDEIPSHIDYKANEDEEIDDFAQSDYESVFKQVVQLEPSLEPLINDIRNIIPPQYKEISQLKYQVKEGNVYARKRMIEMHLRQAVKIALQNAEAYDMDVEDAFEYACIGLITAVDRYDPDTNGAFSSYASFWMFQNISRHQPTQNPHIYYPVHKKESYLAIYPELKQRGCLGCDLMQRCSDLQNFIMEKLNCTSEQINDILMAVLKPYSIEQCLDSMTVVDAEDLGYVTNNYADFFVSNFDLDAHIDKCFLKSDLKKLLETLTDREKDIIIARFGLDGTSQKTLAEVGNIFHVTRERIRQIEAKALKKLRKPSRSNKIKDYL